MQTQFIGERIVFLTNCIGTFRYLYARKKEITKILHASCHKEENIHEGLVSTQQ
jgi:hypothetical protein